MIIVDIEGTGTEPHLHSMLSIGALDFDNPKNTFYEECRMWDGAKVEDEALAVCGFTREQIVDPKKQSEAVMIKKFIEWASTCKEHTFAGQSVSFDRDFLKYAAIRARQNWPFAHRTVDLHAVCYFDMIRKGIAIPTKNGHSGLNLDRVLEYVGIPQRTGTHNAFDDAKLEAESFSRLFYRKPLLEEYKKFLIPF